MINDVSFQQLVFNLIIFIMIVITIFDISRIRIEDNSNIYFRIGIICFHTNIKYTDIDIFLLIARFENQKVV